MKTNKESEIVGTLQLSTLKDWARALLRNSIGIATLVLIFATQVNAQSDSATLDHSHQREFQQQFERLSPEKQAQIRAEAILKEDYEQFPVAPSKLTDQTVIQFCKLLPRGLETSFPKYVTSINTPAQERLRTELWARYLSCRDSLLYYEGHRFFNSGHYSTDQIISAIFEIEKVMCWIELQTEAMDSLTENNCPR